MDAKIVGQATIYSLSCGCDVWVEHNCTDFAVKARSGCELHDSEDGLFELWVVGEAFMLGCATCRGDADV